MNASYLVVASNDSEATVLRHLVRIGRYMHRSGSSGLAYIDDICESGQGIDTAGARAYYSAQEVALSDADADPVGALTVA